jgi:hypothetical protein
MSIWKPTTRPAANFDEEQAARSAVFNKIAPKDNWKNPILCWIKEDEFEECNEAAIWFTGAGLTVVYRVVGTNAVRVSAPGYYATIGA